MHVYSCDFNLKEISPGWVYSMPFNISIKAIFLRGNNKKFEKSDTSYPSVPLSRCYVRGTIQISPVLKFQMNYWETLLTGTPLLENHNGLISSYIIMGWYKLKAISPGYYTSQVFVYCCLFVAAWPNGCQWRPGAGGIYRAYWLCWFYVVWPWPGTLLSLRHIVNTMWPRPIITA